MLFTQNPNIFFIVTSTQALIFLTMKIAPKNNWWCIHPLGIEVAKGLGRDCAVSRDLPGFIPRYTDIPRTERSTKGIHSTSLHFPFISKFYNCLRACLSEWKCVYFYCFDSIHVHLKCVTVKVLKDILSVWWIKVYLI